MSRKKTVFDLNQLAHVWANQSTDEGRTSSGRCYFFGPKIYSYGSHYLAAQIHTLKNGKKIALCNSHGYSMQTGVHNGAIRGALRGLMDFFYASNPGSLKDTQKEFDANAVASVTDALKAMRITSKHDINWRLESIQDRYKSASEFRKLLGLKPIKAKATDLKKVRAHLQKRYDRFLELNTPDMIAKREAKNARAKAIKLEKMQKENAERAAIAAQKHDEALHAFRAGLPFNVHAIARLDYDLIRVQGNEVVTHRGARVPLKDAIAFMRALESNRQLPGQTIGGFTYQGIETNDQGAMVLVIGCHRILEDEAIEVLKPHLNNLTLINGGAS